MNAIAATLSKARAQARCAVRADKSRAGHIERLKHGESSVAEHVCEGRKAAVTDGVAKERKFDEIAHDAGRRGIVVLVLR